MDRLTFGWGEGLPAGISSLSQRELEVFRALGDGASNRLIARKLAIKERTVKAHVAQILAKLRVESRLQAGIVAFAWAMCVGSAEKQLPSCATDVDRCGRCFRLVNADQPQDGGSRGGC